MPRFEKTQKQQEASEVLASPAQHIMLYGGSRSGKTFILVRAIVIRALRAPDSRHAIWRYRINHVRASIWADTLPKVMKLCFPGVEVDKNKQEMTYRFGNGSEIWLGGLDNEDRVEKILGQEYSTIYFNECSQIPYPSVSTALTRLAQQTALANKAYYDCNPPGRKHWTYSLFVDGRDPESKREVDRSHYAHIQMNPVDNLANLAPGYIEKTLANLPARKRQRFLEGEFSDDKEGALWNYGIIRRAEREQLPDMRRIVVAIDPAVTANEGSDETGIVVVALGVDGNGYVLEDGTLKGSPDTWARAAVSLFNKWHADRIVAEVNQGGDLVENTIRTVNPNVPYKAVRAFEGKRLRAEPIAALYEQGRVFHVGDFEELEEQMCDFSLDFDRKSAGYSPDRLDAVVHGLTELMIGPTTTGVLDYYKQKLSERDAREAELWLKKHSYLDHTGVITLLGKQQAVQENGGYGWQKGSWELLQQRNI